MRTKTFDCVEMKRRVQEKIRELVAGMTPRQEVEFFRAGAEEFEEKIRAARDANESRGNRP